MEVNFKQLKVQMKVMRTKWKKEASRLCSVLLFHLRGGTHKHTYSHMSSIHHLWVFIKKPMKNKKKERNVTGYLQLLRKHSINLFFIIYEIFSLSFLLFFQRKKIDLLWNRRGCESSNCGPTILPSLLPLLLLSLFLCGFEAFLFGCRYGKHYRAVSRFFPPFGVNNRFCFQLGEICERCESRKNIFFIMAERIKSVI